MGYYSNLTGRIIIEPPLQWCVVRASRFVDNNQGSVEFEISSEVEETDDGTVTTQCAVAVVPSSDEQRKHYEVEAELREIGGLVLEAGAKTSGYLVRSGEENGDVERYSIHNAALLTEKAQLMWPDGTEAQPWAEDY